MASEAFRDRLFEEIGRKLAKVRKHGRQRVSQAKLASRVGITRSAVSAIEAGHQGVSVPTLCQLAVALDVAPSELLPDQQEIKRLTEQPGRVPAESLVEEYLESHG